MKHRAAAKTSAAVEHRSRTSAEDVSSSTVKNVTAATVERATAAVKCRAAVESAPAAAMESATAAVKSSTATTAVESTTATAAVMTTTASAAGTTDLNGQRIRRRLGRGPSARAHGRHGKRRPAGRAREYEQCCRRKTEATSKTSLLVFHPHHGPFSLNAVQRWTHAAPMLVVRSMDWRTPT